MTVPAWLRGAVVLALTLGAGIAIGVAFERRHAPVHADVTAHADQMVDHFTRELHLDSAQKVAVAAIFARRQHTIDSTWRAVQPHVHATIDSTLREMARVLRPDQLAIFERLIGARHPGTLSDSGPHHR